MDRQPVVWSLVIQPSAINIGKPKPNHLSATIFSWFLFACKTVSLYVVKSQRDLNVCRKNIDEDRQSAQRRLMLIHPSPLVLISYTYQIIVYIIIYCMCSHTLSLARSLSFCQTIEEQCRMCTPSLLPAQLWDVEGKKHLSTRPERCNCGCARTLSHTHTHKACLPTMTNTQ